MCAIWNVNAVIDIGEWWRASIRSGSVKVSSHSGAFCGTKTVGPGSRVAPLPGFLSATITSMIVNQEVEQ